MNADRPLQERAGTLGEQGPGTESTGRPRPDHRHKSVRNLEDGAQPAGDTLGLGQLAVSAMTAFRFFEWLYNGYLLDGWPLARVRLLMSPLRAGVGKTAVDELDGCAAAVVDHSPEATFTNCKSAIESWFGDLLALRAPVKGRSLFFFSGHGVQISRANQLLLPSDYGRTATALNEAIRTQNLFECLASLPNITPQTPRDPAAELGGTHRRDTAKDWENLNRNALAFLRWASIRANGPKALPNKQMIWDRLLE